MIQWLKKKNVLKQFCQKTVPTVPYLYTTIANTVE